MRGMTGLRILAATLVLLTPVTATAQDVGGAWKVEGDRVSLRIAKVGFPTRAAGVALTKTGEFSDKGEALDNYAQFESNDRAVFATAYVYRPTYADTALAAYATDQAITERFGPTMPAAQTTVAFAGTTDGAIRQIFTGAIDGKAMATTAAFARVGSWVVKLRATGPADRAAEVTAALDTLIAGATIDPDAMVYPARPLAIGAPCPAADGTAPKVVHDGKDGAMALLGGLSGGSMLGPDKKRKVDPLISFPANGATAVCVRGTLVLGDRKIDLIQPAGTAEPDITLAVVNDAGVVISVEKTLGTPGYSVKRYAIGKVEVANRVDRMPTPAQLSAWMQTPDSPETALVATVTVRANGSTTTIIDRSLFK